MAEIINLAQRRKQREPQQSARSAAGGDAPCDSGESEQSDVISVHRGQERQQLDERVTYIEETIAKLEEHGLPVNMYRSLLSLEFGNIEEFRRLIPHTDAPYSPRAADRLAFLSNAEYQMTRQLLTNLLEIAQKVAYLLKLALQCKQIEMSVNSQRNTVKARLLRLTNTEDPDLSLCTAIDVAANPHLYIDQCDRLLAEAKTALAEERFGDAEARINAASTVPTYLQAVARALAGGALEEIRP